MHVAEGAQDTFTSFCVLGRFELLLEGCQLFIPELPLVSFLRLLQAFSWSEYTAMAGHLHHALVQMHDCIGAQASETCTGERSGDAAWALQTWWQAAEALLQQASTGTQRVMLLRALVSIDLPLPHGSGNLRFRAMKVAYELMDSTADSCISWSAGHHTVNSAQVLSLLIQQSRWSNARRWASMTAQPQEAITRAQADGICREWQTELGGHLTEGTQLAWRDIDVLFKHHQYPSWLAAQYFVGQADQLSSAASGPELFSQQLAAFKIARAWLDADSSCPDSIKCRLGECLHVLTVLSSQPSQTTSNADKAAGVVAEKDAPLSLDDHEDHMRMFWHMLDDKIAAIVPSTSKPVLVGAVHLALDQGNEALARRLSTQLPSPPIELALIEASQHVLASCTDSSSDTHFPAEHLPAAVLSYLRQGVCSRPGTH